jgi:DNA-binding transcriptional LysR family regulator
MDDLIDLSLMTQKQTRPEKILFKPIMQTNYQLYVPEDHPLINQAPVAFESLAKENLILFNKGFNINEVITNKFKELQLKPKILLQTGQVQNVKKLIEEGLGIGFLIPECVSPKDNIVPVKLTDPIKTTVGLEWKKDRTLYSDEANFVKFIMNNF